MAIEIVLTEEQLERAMEVAWLRQNAAEEKRRPSAHGYNESSPLDVHYQGCVTELATAFHLGKKWHAYLENLNVRNGKKPPDVGERTQVRGTNRLSGRLLVHKTDADDDIFVLAIWKPPNTVLLIGWLYGHECKKKEFWAELQRGRPCYAVPQDRLRQFVSPRSTVTVQGACTSQTSV